MNLVARMAALFNGDGDVESHVHAHDDARSHDEFPAQ